MPRTIVLIDDDPDDLDVLQEVIKEIDPSACCITFTNPEDALKAISDELIVIPDVIVLDINMSPFTGDKCLRELRKNSGLANTSIAMVSTSIPKAVADALLQEGADFTIEKPNRFEDHHAMIKQLLFSEGRSR